MKHLSIGISVVLITACAHERARTEHVTAAASVATAPPSQTAAPVPTAGAQAATGSQTAGAARQSAAGAANAPVVKIKSADGTVVINAPVNTDLIKQGYHTDIRRGQLVYCRVQGTTGTRFKSQVCLPEEQILEAQKNAKDFLNTPRANQCAGSCR